MQLEELYPLKFQTLFKDKIWGGNKIKEILGKDFGELPNCGETWEVSGVTQNGDTSTVSIVAEGALKGQKLSDLLVEYGAKLVGEHVYQRFGNEFPLLVKFIDANQWLSIQVHPDDKLAKERHDSKGKTEMWYILQADEGAELISGFNCEMDENKYLKHFENKDFSSILNKEKVQAGDVFFIPAGRVHTIGKGILLAEIQQTSDITYRIYDFDRKDASGNQRELHTEQALAAIDYQKYENYKTAYHSQKNETVNLAKCTYFTTNILDCDSVVEKNYSKLDSFVIYICVEGALTVQAKGKDYLLKQGETLLLPSDMHRVELVPKGKFKILETYIS